MGGEVGGDAPAVAIRILELTAPVAIELVLDGTQGDGAGFDCPVKRAVHVLYVRHTARDELEP